MLSSGYLLFCTLIYFQRGLKALDYAECGNYKDCIKLLQSALLVCLDLIVNILRMFGCTLPYVTISDMQSHGDKDVSISGCIITTDHLGSGRYEHCQVIVVMW